MKLKYSKANKIENKHVKVPNPYDNIPVSLSNSSNKE